MKGFTSNDRDRIFKVLITKHEKAERIELNNLNDTVSIKCRFGLTGK